MEILVNKLKNALIVLKKIVTNKWFIISLVSIILFVVLKTSITFIMMSKQMAVYSQPKPVDVIEMKIQEVKKGFEFSGRVEAKYTVDLVARVQGFLQKSYFKEGDFVKKGQLLFLIEPHEYEIAVKNAQAAISSANASLVNAEKNLVRAKELVKQDFVSKSYYDDALAQRDLYKGNLDSGRAQLAQAKLNLSYTKITAPVDGKMGKILITEGNLVNLSSGTIAKLISTNPIYVTFTLKSEDYLKFKRADSTQDVSNTIVNLKLSDGTKYNKAGKVEFIDNAVDISTGTITMRATFENPDNLLVPGDYITVYLNPINPRSELLVPMEAVQDSADGFFVYVIENETLTNEPPKGFFKKMFWKISNKISSIFKKKNKEPQKVAKIRHIKATEQYNGNWVIDDGLKEGDIVITQGIKALRDNAPVKIKEEKTSEQNKTNDNTEKQ